MEHLHAINAAIAEPLEHLSRVESLRWPAREHVAAQAGERVAQIFCDHGVPQRIDTFSFLAQPHWREDLCEFCEHLSGDRFAIRVDGVLLCLAPQREDARIDDEEFSATYLNGSVEKFFSFLAVYQLVLQSGYTIEEAHARELVAVSIEALKALDREALRGSGAFWRELWDEAAYNVGLDASVFDD